MDNIPTYDLVLGSEENGVFVASLVDEPAHESDFVAFSKEIKMSKADKDKRIITGPVLIPDIQIYRSKPEPHYVKMSKETIEEAQIRFSKLSDNTAVNFGHDADNTADVTIIEQWIVMNKDNDKSNALGLDVPEGSWMMSMRIDDETKWEDIKERELFNGISIEGIFTRELIEDKTLMEKDEKSLLTKLAELLNFYSPKEEEVKEEEVVEETKPEEEVKPEEEEVKPEEVEEIKEEPKEVTFSKEEVDVMIAEALAKKDEELALAKDEELLLAKEEEVETVMSRSTKGSDKMKETIEYFNKLKNK